MAVDPECAVIGDGFTVTATGLEPDAEYTVMIDPRHSDQLEPGVPATVDAEGALEVSATLPEDAEVQPGEYTLTVFSPEGSEIARADLVIAETQEDCPA